MNKGYQVEAVKIQSACPVDQQEHRTSAYYSIQSLINDVERQID